MFNFFKKKKDNHLYAPVTGEMIAIENVPDEMFAGKMMGDGVGFKFTGNTVYAPCTGEIMMIAGTKHAIAIKAENGAELLIHIGLDTVKLNGEGFKTLVKQGDKVKKGMPLIEVDQAVIKAKNIDLTTPMVITNGDSYHMSIEKPNKNVVYGESVVLSFQ